MNIEVLKREHKEIKTEFESLISKLSKEQKEKLKKFLGGNN